jgi:flagellin
MKCKGSRLGKGETADPPNVEAAAFRDRTEKELEMPQVINTNIMSLNAQRNLNTSQSAMSTAVQRLSSGLRVNSAKDDAAGLAIAERLNATVRGLSVAMRNAQDGISLFQTAEGAMAKLSDNVQRIRELAVQAANGSIGDAERDLLQLEADQLTAENQRIVDSTEFNGVVLLDGSATATTFQVGANDTDTIDAAFDTAFDLSGINTYGGAGTVDISTATAANTALADLTDDLDTINTARANAGALQNRFEAVISQISIAMENQTAAKSRIMDADYAAETASLTRAQILQQAGVAMLAQANAAPQNVLALLRG